jgi:cellobiose-specific phosphotransferase system component IIB
MEETKDMFDELFQQNDIKVEVIDESAYHETN